MGKFHKELNTSPDAIKTYLPKAASSVLSDLSGWVLSGVKSQVVFWEVKKGFAVSGHYHPYDEWGVVITGSCSLTSRRQAGTLFYRRHFRRTYLCSGCRIWRTCTWA